MTALDKLTVGFIGCGNMGGALAKAIASKHEPQLITVSAAHPEKAEAFAKATLCKAGTNLQAAQCDVVFLGVKPNMIGAVLSEIKPALKDSTILVSMAAGISLDTINGMLINGNIATIVKNVADSFTGKKDAASVVHPALVRIMPNMPSQVGQGMIALSSTDAAAETVKALLAPAGRIEQIDEKLMNAVTAVSGSGPAFVFAFIEAMADAAVRCGMKRDLANIYAAQTVLGSAQMVLETGSSPAVLKDAVCSPAGTTIEGMAALEKAGMRSAVIEAVNAAYTKSVSFEKK